MDTQDEETLSQKAIQVGATVFEQQFREDFGAIELQERMYAALDRDLQTYSREFWLGYTSRSHALNYQQ